MLAERVGDGLWHKMQSGEAAPTIEQIKEVLREAQNLERGLTLRLAVAIPMTLQFLKMCFIRGIPLTTMFGMMYFFNWLAVEVLMLVVDWSAFSEDEHEEAFQALIQSTRPTLIKSGGDQVSNLRPNVRAVSADHLFT
jgi:hypothetical protein